MHMIMLILPLLWPHVIGSYCSLDRRLLADAFDDEQCLVIASFQIDSMNFNRFQTSIVYSIHLILLPTVSLSQIIGLAATSCPHFVQVV